MAKNSPVKVMTDIVSNPVSLVLLVFICVMLFTSSNLYKNMKAKREAKKN